MYVYVQLKNNHVDLDVSRKAVYTRGVLKHILKSET